MNVQNMIRKIVVDEIRKELSKIFSETENAKPKRKYRKRRKTTKKV